MQIYYNVDEGNFYSIVRTRKTLVIDLIKEIDGITLSEIGTIYDNQLPFIIYTNKRSKHCLRYDTPDEVLVYPYQNGQPFFLRKATVKDVDGEILSCLDWGVSTKFYEALRKHLTNDEKQCII